MFSIFNGQSPASLVIYWLPGPGENIRLLYKLGLIHSFWVFSTHSFFIELNVKSSEIFFSQGPLVSCLIINSICSFLLKKISFHFICQPQLTLPSHLLSPCLPPVYPSPTPQSVYCLGSKQIRHTNLKYDQAPPCSIKAKQGNPS